MPTADDDEGDWSPEKERRRNPDEFLDRLIKVIEKMNRPHIPPPPSPVIVDDTRHATFGLVPTITIWAIENGFVMHYPKRDSTGQCRMAEVFISDPRSPLLNEAFDELNSLKKG